MKNIVLQAHEKVKVIVEATRIYLKFDNFLLESWVVDREGSFHCSLILTALLERLRVVYLVLLVFRKYLQQLSNISKQSEHI